MQGNGMRHTTGTSATALTMKDCAILHSVASERLYEMQSQGQTGGVTFNELRGAVDTLRLSITARSQQEEPGIPVYCLSHR